MCSLWTVYMHPRDEGADWEDFFHLGFQHLWFVLILPVASKISQQTPKIRWLRQPSSSDRLGAFSPFSNPALKITLNNP